MKFWIQLMLCLICASVCAEAQLYPDSKGRDFWFSFLPNYHNGEQALPGDANAQLEHQLYIYVGSETRTSGTITIRNIGGVSSTIPFTINDPTVLFEHRVFFDGIELRGENRGGILNASGSQAEAPAPQSVHIVSEADVTVYAMNQARTTSDAFLVLPTDALTGDYVVMSYWSDILQMESNKTPSQFVVVATEPNTRVEITTKAQTTFSPAGWTTVTTLQQGESFLMQSNLDAGVNIDLTGSVVRANKPVAVFGGQQRATIPIGNPMLSSRDCLIEQMSPVGTWGKSAFITPFAQSSNELNVGTDLFRVLAAFDSTAVIVNGAFQLLLNAGQFYEAPLVAAAAVTTSRPSLVAQFKKTTGQVGQQISYIGDPLMMLVPPSEQFMSEYRFINVQSYDYDIPAFPTKIYIEQYLNIVVPTSNVAGLFLDGAPISPSRFQKLGQTPFSWSQMEMTDGVHHIKGDTTFGIYVYGYGVANSYGYIGGMAFRPLDTYPPVILGTPRCGAVSGVVADSLLGDSRVSSITIVPGSEENVTLLLGAFTPPQSVVQFQASLVNPYADGSIEVDATDGVGQTFRRKIDVPGFTVGVIGHNANEAPKADTMVLPVGKQRCDSVQLINYGKYPVRLTALRFTSGTPVVDNSLPLTLAPNETHWVGYCRMFASEGMIYDTLIISDSCRERKASEILMDAQLDKRPPFVQRSIDPCSTTITVKVSDIADTDFGLESAHLIDSIMVNCTATPAASDPVSIVGHTAEWSITVIDPYQDAIYGYEAIDSAGNVATAIDTIPGFTLEVAGVNGAYREHTMQAYSVGLLGCETITLRNYGAFGISVGSVRVVGNVLFSIPQHQLPMFLAAGAAQTFEICFSPIESDTTRRTDTLVFAFGCTESRLAVQAEGTSLPYSGVSRCDVPVGTDIRRLAPSGFLAAPLPTRSRLTLVFAEPVTNANIRLVDLTGVEAFSQHWEGSLTKGLAIDVDEVPNGSYVCVVETAGKVLSAICVVSR